MKISWLCTPHTIRHRLILLSIITIGMIIALVSLYSYQLVSLENKLVTMEQVDDLFNSILELRRFEKNIMLKLDDEKERAESALAQEKIESSLRELREALASAPEQAVLAQLDKDFRAYRDLFVSWCASGACTSREFPHDRQSRMVRQQGQRLVDHAARLLRLNRKNISKSFKSILFWVVFMPSMLFLCGAVIFFTQSRSILHRLSILKQGTKNLAAGEFKKVELPNHGRPDEVTGLINNFNEMVEALEHKQEQLIQSKKMASIGTFSSGIAHEINNPLNNISLSADILLEDFDEMDREEIIEILEDIMTQTERASTIVRNLLDFSRARASEMEPLYIDYVIHKTSDLIANELRIHKIALHKDIEDMLPRVNGDLRKLQQVFLNLIINAEQAIGEYGRIEISARKTDNGYVRVDVSDTGPGISPEHLDQIFDPFFTTKEAGKGTGLGLAIVYGIVEKHGGYIEVSSKVGEGTTFSVYLPACPYETKEPEVDGAEA